jgi:hypothetical protein
MERLHFEYAASLPIKQRAHVGVLGSGDLEVLFEPFPDQRLVKRFDEGEHLILPAKPEDRGSRQHDRCS